MRNVKNFVTLVTGMALVCASMVNMDAKAYYSEDIYYDTYKTMVEWTDKGEFKCSHENLAKLGEIYTKDDENHLINAYKWSRVCDSNYAVQVICMTGYEVDGYYFYRSYVMTAATYNAVAFEVTDVSMRWHCIKWEKISECYEVDYA